MTNENRKALNIGHRWALSIEQPALGIDLLPKRQQIATSARVIAD
jgi:hypothetical protein